MKKSLINAMVRQYGATNKWVVLFQEKMLMVNDNDAYEIRRWFTYCDINARG